MLPKILLVIFILCVSLTFILWDMFAAPPPMQAATNPQVKELAIAPKPFVFQTLSGETISSETLKGKVIVLNFWASWCTPCIKEFPDLNTLTQTYPEDVVFLALSVDENKDKAIKFVEKFSPQANRIIGHDEGKTISQDIFQTTMYPETYILDRNFIIRRHIVGVIDWTDDAIKTDLESLIAQPIEKP